MAVAHYLIHLCVMSWYMPGKSTMPHAQHMRGLPKRARFIHRSYFHRLG
jgi:hypothetical protein